jgi:mRNA-degrading endonuclease RelE of RelBE toxin-antitoxin system
VGSYRVVFQRKERELIILVVRIGHRKDIYTSELP